MTTTELYNIGLVLYRKTIEEIESNQKIPQSQIDDWYLFGQRDALLLMLDLIYCSGDLDKSEILAWNRESKAMEGNEEETKGEE